MHTTHPRRHITHYNDENNGWIWSFLTVVVFVFLSIVSYATYERYKNWDYNADLMLTTPAHPPVHTANNRSKIKD